MGRFLWARLIIILLATVNACTLFSTHFKSSLFIIERFVKRTEAKKKKEEMLSTKKIPMCVNSNWKYNTIFVIIITGEWFHWATYTCRVFSFCSKNEQELEFVGEIYMQVVWKKNIRTSTGCVPILRKPRPIRRFEIEKWKDKWCFTL